MGFPFVFLLNRAAAVTAFTAVIAAVFWRRRAVKCVSINDASTSSVQEEASQSYSGVDEVPTIFLSHSGCQKAFVENLYNALQSANHTAFFDKHTLPKASSFPPRIKQAARGCKLGVVVLSEDFLTSKWPMLELEILVNKRNRDVLPLFYKIRPEDLTSPTNLTKWRRVWRKKGGEDADKWEQAVKALDCFNGEVFVERTSEVAFINKVVRIICNRVPSPISHDLSQVKGINA